MHFDAGISTEIGYCEDFLCVLEPARILAETPQNRSNIAFHADNVEYSIYSHKSFTTGI